jgi:HK97 family phage major capsid protein
MALTTAQKRAKLAAIQAENKLLSGAIKRIAANRTADADDTRDTITRRAFPSASEAKKRILNNPAPGIRHGENSLSSRPYMFHRAAALASGALKPHEAKTEFEMSDRLRKAFHNRAPGWKDVPVRNGPEAVIAPLGAEFFYNGNEEKSIIDKEFAFEMKSLLSMPLNYDPEEHQWMVQKGLADANSLISMKSFGSGFTQKVGGSNQSFLQETLGGALVPFPEFGPLVPLLRNKSAVLASGAQIFPLPPSGRIAFPRQTGPTTAYHVGEGVAITQSSVATGQIEFAAKKIGAYLITNNELLRYGGPIVEQLFRNDMTITVTLQLDQDLMVGPGSDNVTQGLVGYSGVQSYNGTGSVSNTNGFTLSPQDIYLMEGQVQAANAIFEGWLIYPTLAAAIRAKRTSVLASGDGLGVFLWNWERTIADGVPIDFLGGHKVVLSANVPNNRVLGSGTNLTTLFGGMWSNIRVGMFGSIEFAMANQGDNTFPQDQTLVRAILSADGGPLNPGAFIYADTLLPTTVGL